MREKNYWGQLTAVDLFNCNSDLKSAEKLKGFSLKLCEEIEMKPFGEPRVERFGEGDMEGLSLIQFIETSTIVVHLDEVGKRVFIDIFSCKEFDSRVAEEFCRNFWGAEIVKIKTVFRG